MIIWLVVDLPVWKIWVRQLGWSFPIYGKIKKVANHQPVILKVLSYKPWVFGFPEDNHVQTMDKLVRGQQPLPRFLSWKIQVTYAMDFHNIAPGIGDDIADVLNASGPEAQLRSRLRICTVEQNHGNRMDCFGYTINHKPHFLSINFTSFLVKKLKWHKYLPWIHHGSLSCRQHDESFEAQSEAAVGHWAEAAQVAVPRGVYRNGKGWKISQFWRIYGESMVNHLDNLWIIYG